MKSHGFDSRKFAGCKRHLSTLTIPGLLLLGLSMMLAPDANASPPAKAATAAPSTTSTTSSKLTRGKTFVNDVLKPRVGKVVVVNFWATWCLPCVKELPELQAAAKELAKKGIDVVLVSQDGKAAAKTRVPAFLEKRGITLVNLVNSDIDPEEMIAAVDSKWSGALPYTVIYDVSGKKIATLTGAQSEEQFIDAARGVPHSSTAKRSSAKTGGRH